MTEVLFYVAADGSSPFEKWFASLDVLAGAKVTVAISRIEQGILSNVKTVGEGVLDTGGISGGMVRSL